MITWGVIASRVFGPRERGSAGVKKNGPAIIAGPFRFCQLNLLCDDRGSRGGKAGGFDREQGHFLLKLFRSLLVRDQTSDSIRLNRRSAEFPGLVGQKGLQQAGSLPQHKYVLGIRFPGH